MSRQASKIHFHDIFYHKSEKKSPVVSKIPRVKTVLLLKINICASWQPRISSFFWRWASRNALSCEPLQARPTWRKISSISSAHYPVIHFLSILLLTSKSPPSDGGGWWNTNLFHVIPKPRHISITECTGGSAKPFFPVSVDWLYIWYRDPVNTRGKEFFKGEDAGIFQNFFRKDIDST